METKYSYAIVGLFVIVLTMALFIMVVWLSIGFKDIHYKQYVVYMKESVSGLSEKAPVKYNGVTVGVVESIELRASDPSQVQIILNIRQGTPITISSKAELDSQGLTGIAYIELMGGRPGEALLVARPGEKFPVIPTEPSLFFRLDKVLDHLSEDMDHQRYFESRKCGIIA